MIVRSRPARGKVHNAFCPTGKGGGVDPTCGKGKGKVVGVKGPPREFNGNADKAEAVAYAHSTHGEWAKGLSPKQGEALGWYSGGSGYKKINDNLREGKPMDHVRIAAMIPEIDSAISSAPAFSEPVTVFRGVKPNVANQLVPGSTFTDKGFGSTTINRSVAVSFGRTGGLLEIKLPPGTRTASIDAMHDYDPRDIGGSENEFLLARNTNYLVTGRKRVGDNLVITVEVISGS